MIVPVPVIVRLPLCWVESPEDDTQTELVAELVLSGEIKVKLWVLPSAQINEIGKSATA